MNINNLGLNIPKELQGVQPVAKDTSKLGKDEFMKLLMTEMRNQDPLEPKSNSESIAQMAQFSSLEQSANLNSSFQDFSKMMLMNSLATSAHVIGKYATVQNGVEEMNGKVVSTSLKDGQVIVKLENANGESFSAKLSEIIALSDKEAVQKEYKVLPENGELNVLPENGTVTEA